jgi:hypothetical protein
LIQFYLLASGDTSTISVQLGKHVYIGWSDFFIFKNKSVLKVLDKKTKPNETKYILGIEASSYYAKTSDKSTQFIIYVDPKMRYLDQYNYGHLYDEIFSDEGHIFEIQKHYIPWQFYTKKTIQEISKLSCSCEKIFNKIGFNPNLNNEVISIDKLFVQN